MWLRLAFTLCITGCDTTPTPGYCDPSTPCTFQGRACNGDNCPICQDGQCGQLSCDPVRHACLVEQLDLGTKLPD